MSNQQKESMRDAAEWDNRLLRTLTPERLWTLPVVWRYTLALVIVVVMTALRVVLRPWLGAASPYSLAIVAAILSTVLLGIGPGLLVVVLGDIAVEIFVMNSLPVILSLAVLLRLGVWIAVGVFLCGMLHATRVAAIKARRSEARLAAFASATFEGIVESEAGRIMDCNEQFARMTDRSVKELRGMAILELIVPEDRERVMANILRGEGSVVEHGLLRPDGTRLVVEAHGRPVSSGGITRYTAVRDITARKSAELALLSERDLLQSVMNGAKNVHLVYLDRDFNFVRVNKAYAATCGYRPEEMIGKNHFVLYPNPEWEAIFARVRDTGEAFEIRDNPFEFPDQPERGITYWDWTLTPVKDAGGVVEGLIFSLHNTTERKRAEQALALRELEYHTLVDNIPDLIVRYNKELRRTYVNPAWEKASGLSRDEAVNAPVSDISRIPQPGMPEYTRKLKSVLEKGTIETAGFFWTNAFGTELYLEYVIVPEYDRSGTIVSALAVGRDLTDRKRAEEMLLWSRERADLLSRTVSALLTAADPQNVVDQLCNEVREFLHCEVFFNYLLDPRTRRLRFNACGGVDQRVARLIEGMELSGSLCGTAAQNCSRVLEENLGASSDPRSALVRSLGVRAYACHPLLGPENQAIGTLSFGATDRDTFSAEDLDLMKAVTDHVAVAMLRRRIEETVRASEQRLAARNIDLVELNRELEAFVYSVSHDLRAPARHMAGFAKILLEDYQDRLDQTGRDYLMRISTGAGKMTHLINDLLRLSQISKQEMIRQTVDLSALALSVTASLKEAEPGRRVAVSITEGVSAVADKGLMEVVLLNLLGNAWKFTSKIEDARIEFGVMKEETKHDGHEGTVYFIKDNGAGFDAGHKDKMFRPFHRFHSEKEFEGTGIGLALVERIIKKHGGRIWAEGTVGRGTTIYFTL